MPRLPRRRECGKEARIDQRLSGGLRFLFRRDVSKLLGIVVFATICIVLFYLSIGDILDYILNYEQNKDPLERLEI